MDARELEFKVSYLKDRRINFRTCGTDFFPDDAFGSSNGHGPKGRPITLHLRGVKEPVLVGFPHE